MAMLKKCKNSVTTLHRHINKKSVKLKQNDCRQNLNYLMKGV